MPMLKATTCMPIQLASLADGKQVLAILKAPIPEPTQLVLLADRKWVLAIPKATIPKPTQLDSLGRTVAPNPKLTQMVLPRLIQL